MIDIEKNFTYHKPTSDQIKLYEQVRGQTSYCASFLQIALPESRELSIALTKLEEVTMWANAAIARNWNKED